MAERDRKALGPFKYLEYFTEDDGATFAGRDREITQVVGGIAKSRLFVLYGGSGSGKTSLLLAGVLPELTRRGYRPVYTRTLRQPTQDLKSALLDEFDIQDRDQSIVELARTICEESSLIIAVDQFEEVFTLFRGDENERLIFIEERETFFQTIGEIVGDDQIDCRFVFSLRQDYLGELDEFSSFLPGLFQDEKRLRVLTAFGARSSIARQLNAAGIVYEPNFLVRVVDFLEQYNYDPTILQVVCSELYRRAQEEQDGQPLLTTRLVEEIGDLRTMFVEYLDELVATIPDKQRLAAGVVLDALMTQEATKRALRPRDILECPFETTLEEVTAILTRLDKEHRLVRCDERDGEDWYELIHERLADVVKEWLNRNEEFFEYRNARDSIVSAVRSGVWQRTNEALLSAGQLDESIGSLRDRLKLSWEETAFVLRSAVFRECPEQFEYWARKFGKQDTQRLLNELLEDDDPGMRRAAAIAARAAQETGLVQDARFGRVFARLALHDDDAKVRQVAGHALAHVAEPRDIQQVSAGIAQKETRAWAREAAVNIALEGTSLRGFTIPQRVRAKTTARRQTLTENAGVLRERRTLGTRRGAMAGMMWSLFIAPIIITGFFWSHGLRWSGSTDSLWAFWTLLGIIFPVALAISALVGRRTLSTHTRSRLLRRKTPWSMVALRVGFLSYPIVLVFGIIVIAAANDIASPDEFDRLNQYLVTMALIIHLLPAVIVYVAGAMVVPQRGRRSVWAWSFLGCNLPVIAVPIVTSLAGPGMGEDLLITVVVVGSASLLVAFAVTINLGLCECERADIDDSPPIGITAVIARASAAAVLVLSFGHGWWHFDWDTVPFKFLAITHQVSEAGVVHLGELGPGYPDSDFFLFEFGEHQPSAVQVLRVTGDLDRVPFRIGEVQIPMLQGSEILTVPAADHWVSVGPVQFGGNAAHSYEFSVRSEPLFDGTEQVTLTEFDWAFTLCTFSLERPIGEEGTTPQAESSPQESSAGLVQRAGPAGSRRAPKLQACHVEAALAPGSYNPQKQIVELVYMRENPSTTGQSFRGQVTTATEPQQRFNVEFVPRPVINWLDQPTLGFEYARSRRPVRVPIGEAGTFEVRASLSLSPGEEPYAAADYFLTEPGSIERSVAEQSESGSPSQAGGAGATATPASPVTVVVAARLARAMEEDEAMCAEGLDVTLLAVGESCSVYPLVDEATVLVEIVIDEPGTYEFRAISLYDSDLVMDVSERDRLGSWLASDDDSLGNLNPLVSVFLQPGTYHLFISEYDLGGVGPFRVMASRAVSGR